MSYINSDLHTEDTFPLAALTVKSVVDLMRAKLDALNEEYPNLDMPVGEAEDLVDILTVRDGFIELGSPYSPYAVASTDILNEGVILWWSRMPTVKERYDSEEAESALRRLIWDEISENCATCGNPIDYCQGHGRLG